MANLGAEMAKSFSSALAVIVLKVMISSAFRLAMAYIEGLDGQEWWQQPELVKNIATELKEFTGITVPT